MLALSVEEISGPGYRRSGSLPSLVLGPWETVNLSRAGAQRDAPFHTTQISRSSKDPARAWEGLNVGPALSMCIARQKMLQHNFKF